MSDRHRSPEQALRSALGVPDDARQVLILAESSHWDPNWLRTADEYYRLVERNLDLALDALAREPRRVYSVECVFFLRMYWERRPDRRDAICELANAGRLRMTGSGVTTADTLLPHPEAILRDWLLGQEWLRAAGINQEPRLAYFTDSFGCSPALPSLLRAAGFEHTALTRVDGMAFMGADYETGRHFPRPGSTASLLIDRERTLDFVWRGPDGAEVLAHWNAFTYGQGDMLAHRGVSRMYLVPFSVPARSERHVARRIQGYIRQLSPFARTPYLFCPIGFDFVPPIDGLVELLDRYNTRFYPGSGVWAVNAGLDDYMALLDGYRPRLPVLELDPNPYWTGFYTSRPGLKARCHDLVDALLLAERLAVASGDAFAPAATAGALERAWWTAAVANHHDLITGTSPDRVVAVEQVPWLDRALGEARQEIDRSRRARQDRARVLVGPGAVQAQDLPPAGVVRPSIDYQATFSPQLRAGSPAERVAGESPGLEWSRDETRIRVHTGHYALELAECGGGVVLRAWDPGGETLLDFASNALVAYRDRGGLWRMGHEFRGGELREIRPRRRFPDRVRLETVERDGGLEVRCQTAVQGEPITRRLWFAPGSPFVCGRIEGRAAARRTLTVRFETGLRAETLLMDSAGGVVVRPRHKVYDPTFWPAQHLAHILAGDAPATPERLAVEGARGVALYLARPGAVALGADGRLETIALRNATQERAFGLIPFPGTPAVGHELEATAFDYALAFTCGGHAQAVDLVPLALAAQAAAWQPAEQIAERDRGQAAVQVDHPGVAVLAVKPASRGPGLIVRLYTLAAAGASLRLWLPGRPAVAAVLCDARERDLETLPVEQGAACLAMPGNVASVRLVF